MRRIFLVGGKLLGIVIAYWTLSALVQIVPFIQLYSDPDAEAVLSGFWYISAFVIYAFLSGLLACVLLFRTEMVADILRIPPHDEAPIIRSPDTPLKIGLVLIGVYAVVMNFPDLARDLVEVMAQRRMTNYYRLARVLDSALKVFLGAYLALKSDRVVEWIWKFERGLPRETEEKSDEGM